MAWFNDDDRGYDRSGGYGRRQRAESAWGWGGGGRQAGEQYHDRYRWGSPYARPGYGGESVAGAGGYSAWRQPDTAFGSNRYGYDYEYRTRPEESPTYGRGGDQAVQRWARRYGYDMGYQVEPQRGRGGTSYGYERGGRGYSDVGRGDLYRGQGYYGGRGQYYGGHGFPRRSRYDWDLRW